MKKKIITGFLALGILLSNIYPSVILAEDSANLTESSLSNEQNKEVVELNTSDLNSITNDNLNKEKIISDKKHDNRLKMEQDNLVEIEDDSSNI